ncbi:MAG: OmpA family protein [Desulfobacterales bacterium]|nr:OmpA family protein [Desulfobacterales bacterium]
MKKQLRKGLITSLIIVLILPMALNAEQPEKGFYIAPEIGYFHADSDFDGRNLKNMGGTPLFYGLSLGYQLNKNLAFEIAYDFIKAEVDNSAIDKDGKLHSSGACMDGQNYRFNGLFSLDFTRSIAPYLTAGIGGLDFDPQYGVDKKLAVNGGLGLKIALTEQLSLRCGVQSYYTYNDKDTDYTIGIGLAYIFAKPEKKKVDSDGDGVSDVDDKCPNTPTGIIVDMNGCPLDDDRDGVPNYLDKCPNTPAGVAVDKNGCPSDDDKDEVPNYLDKCPNTPAGIPVDKYGCPLDDDNDGVPNYLDKCPGTPLNTKVDINGCPEIEESKTGAAEQSPVVIEEKPPALLVLFDLNKSGIKKEYMANIEAFAKYLQKYPEVKATIEGHADSTGADAYNKKLSKKRADAVVKIFVNKFGIESSRLTVIAYGESNPIADNKTKEGRKTNRRAVSANIVH